MGQGVGHVYGTGRTRLWDRSGAIVLDGWIGIQDPLMGRNWGGWVFKGFPPPSLAPRTLGRVDEKHQKGHVNGTELKECP